MRLAEREDIPQDAIEAWEHARSLGIQVEIDPQSNLFAIADCMDFSSNQRNHVSLEGFKQALLEVIATAEQNWPFA